MAHTVSGIAELVLLVDDVDRAAVFYRDVVGLEPESAPDTKWAWFRAGDEQRLALHRGTLLFEEHSPHPPGRRFGNVHFALRVAHDRIGDAIANLQAHGIEIHGPTRFEWMRATSHYFYDPDGNLLEYWTPDA